MLPALEIRGRGDPSLSADNTAIHFLVFFFGDDSLRQEGVIEVSEPQLLVHGLVLVVQFTFSHKIPPFPEFVWFFLLYARKST